MYRSAYLLTALLLGCAAADSAQVQPPTLDAWTAAHNRGDLDGLVAEYAADAVLLPPDGAVQSGQDAVRAAFAGTVSSEGVRIQPTTSWHHGELAAEVGRWEHFTRDTHETTSRGTYTVVWQRDAAGQWRIVENGWAVAPAPEAGT